MTGRDTGGGMIETEKGRPQFFCERCGEALTGKVVWLELDQRSQTYHNRGGVPTDKSQGWFPFGATCAKRCLEVKP